MKTQHHWQAPLSPALKSVSSSAPNSALVTTFSLSPSVNPACSVLYFSKFECLYFNVFVQVLCFAFICEFLKLPPLTWPYRVNTLAGSFLFSLLKVEIYIIYISCWWWLYFNLCEQIWSIQISSSYIHGYSMNKSFRTVEFCRKKLLQELITGNILYGCSILKLL